MSSATAFTLTAVLAATTLAMAAPRPPQPANEQYAQWKNGPPTDPKWFPIGVWCQSPRNAERYKAIGVSFYLALHGGPTEDELARFKKVGMPVICSQNEVGLKHLDDKTIIGWMHGDEPDNCKQEGGKWVPVARPAEIIADYQRWRKRDPSRPVLLNLGQGIANIGYKGSWVRDDKEYVGFIKGCDIVSYDIYPVVGNRPETDDKLHLVPFGVDRLYQLSGGRKIVWNIVECTRISQPRKKPTPHQVKAEVWMSLVHGSTGIVYFCHEFKVPDSGGEAALLADADMAKAVGEINRQIHELAPALNSATIDRAVTVRTSAEDVPVDTMVKRHDGAVYLFAVGMRPKETKAAFQLAGLGDATAEVLGESRTMAVRGGRFVDEFKPYDVHLYKITRSE